MPKAHVFTYYGRPEAGAHRPVPGAGVDVRGGAGTGVAG